MAEAINPCGGSAPSGTGSTGGGTPTEGGAAQGGGLMGMLFPLAIFVLIFYFFIIRPQKKRDKQHNNMIASIGRGDQIVTIGGFLGTVKEVRDDTFQIELAEGVRVRILKSAVQTKRTATATPSTEKPALDNQGASS
jgi:preprotein translocase subunit YajC